MCNFPALGKNFISRNESELFDLHSIVKEILLCLEFIKLKKFVSCSSDNKNMLSTYFYMKQICNQLDNQTSTVLQIDTTIYLPTLDLIGSP